MIKSRKLIQNNFVNVSILYYIYIICDTYRDGWENAETISPCPIFSRTLYEKTHRPKAGDGAIWSQVVEGPECISWI